MEEEHMDDESSLLPGLFSLADFECDTENDKDTSDNIKTMTYFGHYDGTNKEFGEGLTPPINAFTSEGQDSSKVPSSDLTGEYEETMTEGEPSKKCANRRKGKRKQVLPNLIQRMLDSIYTREHWIEDTASMKKAFQKNVADMFQSSGMSSRELKGKEKICPGNNEDDLPIFFAIATTSIIPREMEKARYQTALEKNDITYLKAYEESKRKKAQKKKEGFHFEHRDIHTMIKPVTMQGRNGYNTLVTEEYIY